MEIVSFLGWFGTILLMLCGLPQLIQTAVTKQVDGLSATTLFMWCAGCICTLVYILLTVQNLPLAINYLFNTLVSGTTFALCVKYRRPKR